MPRLAEEGCACSALCMRSTKRRAQARIDVLSYLRSTTRRRSTTFEITHCRVSMLLRTSKISVGRAKSVLITARGGRYGKRRCAVALLLVMLDGNGHSSSPCRTRCCCPNQLATRSAYRSRSASTVLSARPSTRRTHAAKLSSSTKRTPSSIPFSTHTRLLSLRPRSHLHYKGVKSTSNAS